MNPEEARLESLRLELRELEQAFQAQRHDQAKSIGRLEGWKEGVDRSLARLERLLDKLLLLQAAASPHPARADTPAGAPAPTGNAR